MAKLFNRAKMTTSTTGSGTVTLSAAAGGFQSFTDAGVSNGDVLQYLIEEGSAWEIGTGTYSSTGTSLTRTPSESSDGGTAITLSGAANVSITAVADDLNRLQHGGSDKVTVSSTGASVTGNISVTGTVDGRDVATDGTKLDGIATNANNYSLPLSSSSTRGGVKIGYTENGKNYPVELSSEKMFVNVPWTDNNTTYSAGSGLSLSGTTFSHTDTSSQASVNNSNGTVIQDVTLDTYGHVTGLTSYNLDGRYYTETEINTKLTDGSVKKAGFDSNGRFTVEDGSGAIQLFCNDGGGNLGLRFNVDDNANSKEDGSAWEIEINNDSSNSYIKFSTDTSISAANEAISYSEEFRFDHDGDFHADGNIIAYSTTTSDPRLKENIQPVTDGLGKVMQLNGYTFDYKADGVSSAGILSTEVAKVLPSAVKQSKLGLKLGDDNEIEYDIVQYDQLTALLIEAIKELKAEIEELKNGASN